jgi:aminoglycoside phosphotransferase (APT) family kinase protein
MSASLESSLPAHLRAPATTITRIAAGLSGAVVYRVEAGGQAFVLKISSGDEPLAEWRRKLEVLRLVAGAGLAPALVHADESRRAALSAFVVDRSFFAIYLDPRTREAAIAQLGRTIRRLHDLPLPDAGPAKDGREFLASVWSDLGSSFALPAFVGDAVRRVLDEEPPTADRPLVLSHNDINPTNLVYDGERLVLLDWETAGANEPFYDLAAVSVFLRMDDATCLSLLAAYDGRPVSAVPARLAYDRRLVAALCGTVILRLARASGHPGASGETIDSTPPLGEFYQRLRSGSLSIATAEGQWWFGLALVKASAGL